MMGKVVTNASSFMQCPLKMAEQGWGGVSPNTHIILGMTVIWVVWVMWPSVNRLLPSGGWKRAWVRYEP